VCEAGTPVTAALVNLRNRIPNPHPPSFIFICSTLVDVHYVHRHETDSFGLPVSKTGRSIAFGIKYINGNIAAMPSSIK
jgi:hypothetical protein